MLDLFYVRHCETIENLLGIIQGRSIGGIPSREGERQSRVIAQRLGGIPFSAVYSANVKRAEYVANAIRDANHNHPVIILDERLRERGYGTLEGKTQNGVGITPDQLATLYATDQEGIFATAESLKDIEHRAQAMIDHVVRTHTDGAIALVSCQWTISYHLNILLGEQISPETYHPLPNCGVAHLQVVPKDQGIHVARFVFDAQRVD